MFGSHKGHRVEPIDQGYGRLRERVEQMMDDRTLNVACMRDRLVEVGHCKRILVEKMNTLLLELDETFEDIFMIVKNRRNHLKGFLGFSVGLIFRTSQGRIRRENKRN